LNFNFIIFSVFILISSCGVKSDPQPPQDTLLPSVESPYLKTTPKEQNGEDQKIIDKKKKSKKSDGQNHKVEDK